MRVRSGLSRQVPAPLCSLGALRAAAAVTIAPWMKIWNIALTQRVSESGSWPVV